MDSSLLSNPLVLVVMFGVGCYVTTFITRRVVEAWKPSLKKQNDENNKNETYTSTGARWWNTVILYALGPFYGVVGALALKSADFFPQSFRETAPVVLLGLVSGFLAGFCYKLLKRILARGVGVKEDIEDEDSPPGG